MLATFYFTVAVIGLVYAGIIIYRRQQEDNRRVRASRDEANRAIDEYEAVHGPGSSPWPKFK